MPLFTTVPRKFQKNTRLRLKGFKSWQFFLFILFFTQPLVKADPYLIRRFIKAPWIQPDSLTGLQVLDSTKSSLPPELVKSGYLTLRSRVSAEEYALFYVKADSQFYSRLHIYKMEDLDYSDQLRTRFFAKNLLKPEEDLKWVLFDSSYIYIPDFEVAYYSFVGEWKKITSLPLNRGHVYISSSVKDASLFQNQQLLGTVPWAGLVDSTRQITFTLKHPDYFPGSLHLQLTPYKTNSGQIDLVPKTSGEFDFRLGYNYRNLMRKDSLQLPHLERRLRIVDSVLGLLTYKQLHLDSLFEQNYPLIAPSVQGETPEHYRYRQAFYLRDKELEKDWLFKDFKAAREEFTTVHDTLLAEMGLRENRMLCDTLSIQDLSGLKSESYDDTLKFSFTLKKEPWHFKTEQKCKVGSNSFNLASQKVLLCGMPIYAGQVEENGNADKSEGKVELFTLPPESLVLLEGTTRRKCQGSSYLPKSLTAQEPFLTAQGRRQYYLEQNQLKLRQLEEAQKLEEQKRELARREWREKSRRTLIRQSITWGGLGLGVVSAVLTYTVSESADESYESYQRAQNREDARHFHQKTEAADRHASTWALVCGLALTTSFLSFSF